MHDDTDFGYPMPDQTARYWAAACHAGAVVFVVVLGGGFVVSLLLWYFKRDASPFIDMHGREAVNFQLSAFVVMLVLTGLTALLFRTCLAFLVAPIMVSFMLVVGALGVWAAYRALLGEPYRYPIALRFF